MVLATTYINVYPSYINVYQSISTYIKNYMDKIQQNVPLADHTTFNIGGPARYFAEIKDKEELKEVMEWADNKGVDTMFLGGGSNVLVSDQGVEALILKLNNDKVSVHGTRLDAGAGTSLARLTRVASGEGLSGLEWAGGIPGATVGGAIRGNAGAFGVDMGSLVETVEVFDRQDSSHPFQTMSNKDCGFGYRASLFKQEDRYIVWSASLKFKKGDPQQIKESTRKIIEKRKRGQPNLANAGCIFKNLSYQYLQENNKELLQHAEETGVVNNGSIPAGWVIDLLELKGKVIGGAKISLEHANFIVNTGKATSMDVIGLINIVKKRAWEELNLEMEEEIQYIGF